MSIAKLFVTCLLLGVCRPGACAQAADNEDSVQKPVVPSSVYDEDAEPSAAKVPWASYDLGWQNGNDRRDHSVLQTKYFTGSFMLDANYTYSFNNPIDNTVVGSTALARNNELQISYVGFGGDFNYRNARGRLMTQFGTRSIVVPRNDYSTYRASISLPMPTDIFLRPMPATTSISGMASMWMPACLCLISG